MGHDRQGVRVSEGMIKLHILDVFGFTEPGGWGRFQKQILWALKVYLLFILRSGKLLNSIPVIPIIAQPILPSPKKISQKSEKLQLKSSKKNEVNNFGFPSSFGKAGVDFPMYDPNK